MADPLKTENCSETEIEAPGIPCETHNICVWGVDERIWRMTQEMTKTVSARVSGITDDDKERWDSYYVELLEYIDVSTQTVMDFHYLARFPLTNLVGIQIPVENEAINSALHYLLAADMNLRASPSGRLNDSLLAPDKKDLVDAIVKSKSLVDTAYANSNPLDQPQSNPRRDVATPSGL